MQNENIAKIIQYSKEQHKSNEDLRDSGLENNSDIKFTKIHFSLETSKRPSRRRPVYKNIIFFIQLFTNIKSEKDPFKN